MNGYLTKPIRIKELREALAKWRPAMLARQQKQSRQPPKTANQNK